MNITKFPSYEWKPRTLTEIYAHQSEELIRIYADGVYDLFHPGHVEQFKQIKAAFPNVYLIIGVCSDSATLKYKGCLPVMNERERLKMINQCRYVDEAYLSPPFFPTMEFVNHLKVDLVAHDALPYNSPTASDCYAIFKACDRFFETLRTPTISTTSLLDRIIKDLERYKQRQLIQLTRKGISKLLFLKFKIVKRQ
uniref:Choline-phosphate cytidylyltransferase n=1 Tax=Panagrolaimus sp. PS1159 TaxID=55785 RepID=A0AC35GVE2_9BILA